MRSNYEINLPCIEYPNSWCQGQVTKLQIGIIDIKSIFYCFENWFILGEGLRKFLGGYKNLRFHTENVPAEEGKIPTIVRG